MNSSVKAIEWFGPMAPVESSKKWNAFSGWWHGMGSHHHSQSFCCPPFLPRFWMCFAFVATFKKCGLSIIELSCSVKPSRFNMSMSVQTIGHLSKKNIWWCQVLDDNACMWIIIVWLSGVFRMYIICKEIIPKEIYGHLLQYFFFSIFKCALCNRVNWVTFFP